ncbi:MAG: amidohydrolase family protein [Muribaculaceae bacterium]|nr:amidohydrolase family protein [Muribaculaceae bacterium]
MKKTINNRGSIVPGKQADLVLVDGDPTKDISVCRNIQRVWVKGIEVDLTK